MTTQTLKNVTATVLKAVNVELPQKVLPAKSKLAGTLADYEKACSDLEDFKARAETARLDENRAMEDEGLSATEAAEKIQTAQLQKGVFTARIANREVAQAQTLKELKASLNGAHNEYCALVRDELARRLGILRGRVTAAGRIGANSSREVDGLLLEHSAPIEEIRSLELHHSGLLFCDTPEQITGVAKRILTGYEAIAAKMKEQI